MEKMRRITISEHQIRKVILDWKANKVSDHYALVAISMIIGEPITSVSKLKRQVLEDTYASP